MLNEFLLQERFVSTVTTEDEKEAIDIEFNVLYQTYDVLYLLIYFPIKLTTFFLFKISLYYFVLISNKIIYNLQV